jgi:hypothetical protein
VDDSEALASAIGALLDDSARWRRLAAGAVATIEESAMGKRLRRATTELYGAAPTTNESLPDKKVDSVSVDQAS